MGRTGERMPSELTWREQLGEPEPTPDPTRLSDSELADAIYKEGDAIFHHTREAARRLRQRGTEDALVAFWKWLAERRNAPDWTTIGIIEHKANELGLWRRPEGT